MKISIDLDATISAYPEFFRNFTEAMSSEGHEIIVITDRMQGTEDIVKKELEQYGITYDKLVITEKKADFILKNNVEVLFDDTDNYFLQLPEEVAVFKVREHYNFDFKSKKWLYTDESGRKVNEKESLS